MNRSERRKLQKAGVPIQKDPIISMKKSDIDQIKKDAMFDALDVAFMLMLSIPTMVIHDKFGQLMKKEHREQTFVDLCLEVYDAFDKGYVTLEDLQECLWQEAGAKFARTIPK